MSSRPKSWFKDGLHLLMTIVVVANFTDSEHGSQDFFGDFFGDPAESPPGIIILAKLSSIYVLLAS